jgi:hypothetical protein
MVGPPRWMGTLTDADELAMNRGSVGSQAPVQYPYEKPRLTLSQSRGLSMPLHIYPAPQHVVSPGPTRGG